MSWGDDPILQDNVQLLRRLLDQLEVGVLWGRHERVNAAVLIDSLNEFCRLRDRCAAVQAADFTGTKAQR